MSQVQRFISHLTRRGVALQVCFASVVAVGLFALQPLDARATALTYTFLPDSTISVSGVGTVSISGGFTADLGADGSLSGVNITFVVPKGYDDVATSGICALGCVSSDPFVEIILHGVNESNGGLFTVALAFDNTGPDLTADTFISLAPNSCSGNCWYDNTSETFDNIEVYRVVLPL